MVDLAIVIPCYKATFLRVTLNSLVSQTNKNFNVYIGNDNSKDNIDEIVASYTDKLNIYYKKFVDNLGSISLVQQWERCIELSSNEQWLWVLPDDDYIDSDCVENVYAAVKEYDSDVYRFNTKVVDEKGEILENPCINPIHETGEHFIADKLTGDRRSSLADYIFSRKIFERYKIVEYPSAWCSDDATWLLFSKEKGIITISNSFVYIRISTESISGNSYMNSIQKTQACLLYLTFLKKKYYKALSAEFEKKNKTFNEVTKRWFLMQLSNIHVKFQWKDFLGLFFKFNQIWGWKNLDNIKALMFVIKRYRK